MVPTNNHPEGFSIYLHVPFCRKACSYCDFYFVTGKKAFDFQKSFVEAIQNELYYYYKSVDSLQSKRLQTIYIGGGTPSLLDAGLLLELMKTIRNLFGPSVDEVTMEINPEDISTQNVEKWIEAGVNRFSIGVQSLFKSHLGYLGREGLPTDDLLHRLKLLRSTASRLASSFWSKKSPKSTNPFPILINLDLMIGFSLLSDHQIASQLKLLNDEAIAPNHFSIYMLEVPERTRLYKEISHQKKIAPNEEEQADQYKQTVKILANWGFQRYEVSNFCKDNHFSLHNLNYWNGGPYLGIGPAAHGYDGVRTRWVNKPSLSEYVRHWQSNNRSYDATSPHETSIPSNPKKTPDGYRKETFLNLMDVYRENVMSCIRTNFGLNEKILQKKLERVCFDLEKSNEKKLENFSLPAVSSNTEKNGRGPALRNQKSNRQDLEGMLQAMRKEFANWERKGFLDIKNKAEGTVYVLTEKGYLFGDRIAASVF